MKPLSEVTPGLLVIQIQIQAVWRGRRNPRVLTKMKRSDVYYNFSLSSKFQTFQRDSAKIFSKCLIFLLFFSFLQVRHTVQWTGPIEEHLLFGLTITLRLEFFTYITNFTNHGLHEVKAKTFQDLYQKQVILSLSFKYVCSWD